MERIDRLIVARNHAEVRYARRHQRISMARYADTGMVALILVTEAWRLLVTLERMINQAYASL